MRTLIFIATAGTASLLGAPAGALEIVATNPLIAAPSVVAPKPATPAVVAPTVITPERPTAIPSSTTPDATLPPDSTPTNPTTTTPTTTTPTNPTDPTSSTPSTTSPTTPTATSPASPTTTTPTTTPTPTAPSTGEVDTRTPADQAPAPSLVCKDDGKAPPADENCATKGGPVAMTGFVSDNYETCIVKSYAVDKLPAHFTPWSSGGEDEGAAATDSDSNKAASGNTSQGWGVADEIVEKGGAARRAYCRGLHPAVEAVSESQAATTSLKAYYSRVAVSLDTVDACVTRLKVAGEIPLDDGLWKDATPEEFCERAVKPAPSAETSGGKKYRSRWDQVGGAWTTGWVPDHTDAVCGSSYNCGCEPNACGVFKKGETTFVWPQGCGGPKWTIRCDSEPQDGSGSGGNHVWARTNNPPLAGQATSCFREKVDVGLACPKAGDVCTKMRGNALAGALVLEYYECR